MAPISGLLEAGAEPADAGRQLYAVLAQLCDGEAHDLVQNTTDSGGWEAWRVLTRRSDPQGAAGDAASRHSSCSQDRSTRKISTVRWQSVYGKRDAMLLPDDIKSSILIEMTEGPTEGTFDAEHNEIH